MSNDTSTDSQTVPAKMDQRIYWAPASNFQLANFIPEDIYPNGKIRQNEVSLEFNENLKVTSRKDEIAFIENSDAFKRGLIQRCTDMKEARTKTAILRAAKTSRTITTQINESIDLTEAQAIAMVGTQTGS